jgi:ankyrin repeat protein
VLSAVLDSLMPDLRQRNAHGQTPLHIAAARGHVPVVELLLRADPAAMDAGDEAGRAPLHVAAAGGVDAVCAALLRAGASPLVTNQCASAHASPLATAC